MEKQSKRFKVFIWTPTVFSGFLTLIMLFLPGDAGAPTYYSFLPMCFFFSGAVTLVLHERITALEIAVRDLAEEAPEPGG
jgi:hypothetical protein